MSVCGGDSGGSSGNSGIGIDIESIDGGSGRGKDKAVAEAMAVTR